MPEKRIMGRLALGKCEMKHVRQECQQGPLYLQGQVPSESDVSVLVIKQSRCLAFVDSHVNNYRRIPLVSGKSHDFTVRLKSLDSLPFFSRKG